MNNVYLSDSIASFIYVHILKIVDKVYILSYVAIKDVSAKVKNTSALYVNITGIVT